MNLKPFGDFFWIKVALKRNSLKILGFFLSIILSIFICQFQILFWDIHQFLTLFKLYNFLCHCEFEILKNFLPGFGTFLLTCIHLYVGTACWAFAGQSPQPERSCGDRSLLKWCGYRPYWLPYDMPSRQGLKEPV